MIRGKKRARSVLAAAGVVAVVTSSGYLGATSASAEPAPAPAPASTATAEPTPTAAPQAPTDSITWTRCGGGLQCGTLSVPLDYNDPSKGMIELAVARRPADDTKRKQGVIFVNPGGPGGPATFAVPQFAQILGRDVRAKFDIVGIDPRGVGGSDLAICEGPGSANDPQPPSVSFPVTDAERKQWFEYTAFVRKTCAESKPRILNYMTTADVARDMDRVRAVLKQDKLNFYGVSYGSYLGATYAAMFPDRVRTMVVDGVLDPVAWATGRNNQAATTPVSTRVNSHRGSQEALFSAFAECEAVGTDECAQADTIRDDWAELTAGLRKAPLKILEIEGEALYFTYQDLIGMTTGMLYDGEGVPDLLMFISEINKEVKNIATMPQAEKAKAVVGTKGQALYRKLEARDAKMSKSRIAYDPPVSPADQQEEQPWPAMFFVATEGVMCSEANNPNTNDAWVKAAARADRQANGFGPQWTYMTSVCAGWKFKGENAFKGSFKSKPAGGMLVMSTLHDPATPYSGAQAVRKLVSNSRLVTVPGWGHGTLDVSGCATKARNDYLLTGKLPARDLSCRPDHRLFTPLD